MYGSIVYMNFAAVATLIFVAGFMLQSGDMFEKKVTRSFIICMGITVLMLLVGNIHQAFPDNIRWASLAWMVRPFVMWSLTIIMMRRVDFRWKAYVSLAPAVIAVLFTIASVISGADVTEPLYFWTQSYIVVIVVAIAYNIYYQIYDEVMMIVFLGCIIMFANRYDFKSGNGMLFWTAEALAICFFVMFFYSQSFKRDVLTGAFNRRCFEADAKRNEFKISALMSLDLNNLKILNDTKGHAEGDRAICTMTNVVRRSLPRNASLYRIGGDEFMIIFVKTDLETVRILKDVIKTNMEKTPYSCAVGIGVWKDDDTLTEVCAKADVAMYEDKIAMKKIIGGEVR